MDHGLKLSDCFSFRCEILLPRFYEAMMSFHVRGTMIMLLRYVRWVGLKKFGLKTNSCLLYICTI